MLRQVNIGGALAILVSSVYYLYYVDLSGAIATGKFPSVNSGPDSRPERKFSLTVAYLPLQPRGGDA